MRLRLNDQAVLCVEIMLDIASWVTQQIFAISMPAICHNRRTTTFYNFSTTFEAKRMAQEDTRRMKKISRIEYCAGFEPLQSGMEQDEGSRILLPTMKPLENWKAEKAWFCKALRVWGKPRKYIFTSNLHQMMLKLMQRRKNRSFGLNSPVPAIWFG